MESFLTVLHVIISIILIGVVLLQSGREGGGDIGGGGGAKPVTSGNKFMERLTSTFAVLFMVTSVFLAAQGGGTSVMKDEVKKDEPAATKTAPGSEKKDEKAADVKPVEGTKPAVDGAAKEVPPTPPAPGGTEEKKEAKDDN